MLLILLSIFVTVFSETQHTMTNESNSEFCDGEFDSQNYKSCFARSVAVNSDFRLKKITSKLDFNKVESEKGRLFKGAKPKVNNNNSQGQGFVRMRKSNRSSSIDANYRYSLNLNESRRSSFCSSVAENPVENIVSQSRIETLEWQLKEVQKSRDMYKALMKQVVIFLEKAQHNLELLGGRMNRKNSSSLRPKSEHQIKIDSSRGYVDTSTPKKGTLEISSPESPMDYFWRQKKEDPFIEEMPPDKLAQEAFRLLRTAQSLLSTREPDLARIPTNTKEGEDIEFLAQIAKEFPSNESTPINTEHRPQRATSFSLSPKLILPGNDVKISTAFNRKLSLQLSDVRRCSEMFRSTDSTRDSVVESEPEFLQGTNTLMNGKSKSEKSSSPPNGSISSVEDESGFSSMNSFQEVGLPVIQPPPTEEVTTKAALLRSMIHNNTDFSSLNFSLTNSPPTESTILANDSNNKNMSNQNVDEVKLWQRPNTSSTPQHKRYNSTPTEDPAHQSLKVFWV